ncbi:hypothetical protein D9M69_522510 [compost metagenome]
MNASNEPGKTLLHTRQVTCRAYLRDDGLIEVEGRMQDVKPVDAHTVYKTVPADSPFHSMRLVMIVDHDFVIQDVQASTEVGPNPDCASIAPAYGALKGLKVGAGFRKQVAQRVGGQLGCTHLTELLGPMGTTLIQSTFLLRSEAHKQRLREDPDYESPRPWVIGTCHSYRPDGEAARLMWPEGYRDEAQPVRLPSGE